MIFHGLPTRHEYIEYNILFECTFVHFDPLCTVHEQGSRNLQLHRETVQSPATFVASHTTWRYRLSLCSMLHFNLLEQAIYCTLANDAAVLTLPTCGLQLVDNFLGVKLNQIGVSHSQGQVTIMGRSHYVIVYIYIYKYIYQHCISYRRKFRS